MITRVQVRWFQQGITMLALTVLLALSQWLGLFNPVQRVIQAGSKPILIGVAQVFHRTGEPSRRLKEAYALAARTEQLEKELTVALATLSELEQVDQENQQLRESLGAQSRPQQTIIGSPIISYGVPTISVGSQQGLTKGSPVLVKGALVGLVDAVSEQQSIVVLLSQQQITPIVVRTESGAEGLVVGDGKRILLTEVAHDQELKTGERIVTAGQTHIPANIFIGTVQEIVSDQSAPVQTATVQQLTSFYEVSLVEVLP